MKAIRYRNLDEARRVMRSANVPDGVFDDDGEEPTGLLSVVPEDRMDEEGFNRLIGAGAGVLVEVEKFSHSGYGPPAEEPDYMGFVSEGVCYALQGRRLPVEIEGCPDGARDIHHLEALVLDRLHPLDRQALAARMNLPEDWSFEDLFERIAAGETTAQEIDRLIHKTYPA